MGLTLRHRLDAQSVAWAIMKGRVGDQEVIDPPVKDLAGPRYRSCISRTLPSWKISTLATAREEAPGHLPRPARHRQNLRRTGTLAKRSGLSLQKERVTLVQFHPSYAYEDFVQGFRPARSDRRTGNSVSNSQDGPLEAGCAMRAKVEPRRGLLPHNRRDQPG